MTGIVQGMLNQTAVTTQFTDAKGFPRIVHSPELMIHSQ
jgi:hypothetical protein